MKTKIILSIITFCFLIAPVAGQDLNHSLGLILNSPNGLSWKFWVDKQSAFDGALHWDIGTGGSSVYSHIDFLRHYYSKVQVEGGVMPFFWGIGGRLRAGNQDLLGVRFPFGISYLYSPTVFEVFFEIVPFFNIWPDIRTSLDGAIGIRVFL